MPPWLSLLGGLTRLLSYLFFGILSGLVLTAHLTLPAALFASIYHYLYGYWLSKVGNGAWAPAWPLNRTRLVLLMGTLPLWGAGMALAMVGSVAARRLWAWWRTRRERRGYRQLDINLGADADGDGDDDRRMRYVRKSGSGRRWGWYAWLGAYLSLVLAGVYMLETYELPGDHRYKADVEKAVKAPRPEGYGDGGELRVRSYRT